MKVKELIGLLEQHDPDAMVVVNDRREFVRIGLLRPLDRQELTPTLVGYVLDGNASWVCPWNETPEAASGPYAAVLVGPP